MRRLHTHHHHHHHHHHIFTLRLTCTEYVCALHTPFAKPNTSAKSPPSVKPFHRIPQAFLVLFFLLLSTSRLLKSSPLSCRGQARAGDQGPGRRLNASIIGALIYFPPPHPTSFLRTAFPSFSLLFLSSFLPLSISHHSVSPDISSTELTMAQSPLPNTSAEGKTENNQPRYLSKPRKRNK
ncbi:hypothetical protein BU24DRAFT_234508 [Aaosphaeria arxii CBS 175.79]|uniref:Uncharacterized protein n=1 Tax=Aaosphaeria arxii CBS 175.79 TaxID=1450172 RepID=A0A6A5XJ66_9PLEO|nr:uncharacterized protein BU24DRAFT_234508 [Aaosphaeria arxii CBS 175.79]KAF2013305.1 hypothetical protein BU24DRAFT_234508 [Aaosphaeria arxii CBS 175.79]